MAAHAILSASGAYRWRQCPPSARLESKFPESSSVYADEGTLAHKIGELFILFELGRLLKPALKTKLNECMRHPLFNKEMIGYCQDYADYVIEVYNSVRAVDPTATIDIEVKLDVSMYIPDGFGTCDVLIHGAGRVITIDLKFGAGVAVDVVENDQQKIYALGAYHVVKLFGAIDTIQMHIYQPRINNIAQWETPLTDLLRWAENDLVPSAVKAYKGEGEFKAGSHCKFCKVKAQCRTLAAHNLELAKFDFLEANLLSDAQIEKVLSILEPLSFWAKAVKEYALKKALEGTQWQGWKVIETQPRRKIIDEKAVASALLKHGMKPADIFREELLTITELEKLIGKTDFTRVLGQWVEKPKGRPELAPLSDKRKPYLMPTESAQSDFSHINI